MLVSRLRQFVRWGVIAFVAPVLLHSSYVSAWLVMPWFDYYVPWVPTGAFEPLFTPIDAYCNSGLHGSGLLVELFWDVNGHLIPRY